MRDVVHALERDARTELAGKMEMIELGRWIGGLAMAALALLGLVAMSRATDPMFGFFGLLLFLFAIAVIVAAVHRATAPERVRPGDQEA